MRQVSGPWSDGKLCTAKGRAVEWDTELSFGLATVISRLLLQTNVPTRWVMRHTALTILPTDKFGGRMVLVFLDSGTAREPARCLLSRAGRHLAAV